MNDLARRTIIFAGGGTAGHIEPALAVARAWKKKYPQDREIFLGTTHGLETTLVPEAGFQLLTIPRVVMPRRISFSLLTLPWSFSKAIFSARKALGGVDLVIGFGGYVCAPAYVAARLERIPIVIHEANAKVGWANRLGSLFTHNLATARQIKRGSFASARTSGLPLRPNFLKSIEESGQDWNSARRSAKERLGWKSDHPTLLILGGSQGSTFINGEIARAIPSLTGQGIQVHHSVGSKNQLPPASSNYLPVLYIEDMATAYLAADVLVARSGAVTCAEFGALGRFALFIPLPNGNGEQARNADYLVEAGRAQLIPQKEFTATWLIENFEAIYSRSQATPIEGMVNDLHAVDEILSLIQESLKAKMK